MFGYLKNSVFYLSMKIYYGADNHYIDVTDICLRNISNHDTVTIPCGDHSRAAQYTDPIFGTKKKIFIEMNGIITEYDDSYTIRINTLTSEISTICENDIHAKLLSIHSTLKINYGSFYEELPEQKMAVRYLTGKERVLEIGGNIGRNSLVIASIVGSNNLVTLECDVNIAKQLMENRDLNQFTFHIEPSALSNRTLIQKGWDTMPSDVLQEGYTWVNTITLDQLKAKYSIEFDTLVLDCEGAFYYILMDMPDILQNIKLIIMENDYTDILKKNDVDQVLKDNHFHRDYVEHGGWGPCTNNFFEVWKK
jgi:FkbM family methyltransferase